MLDGSSSLRSRSNGIAAPGPAAAAWQGMPPYMSCFSFFFCCFKHCSTALLAACWCSKPLLTCLLGALPLPLLLPSRSLALILLVVLLDILQLLDSAAASALQHELLLQRSCSSMEWHALLLLSIRAHRWPAAGSPNRLCLPD
jgi:hypothetical protein